MYIKDKTQFSSKRVYTDEGFLSVPATLARTGIQEYFAIELGLTDRDPTDIVNVYRPAEEVFHADSMASFAKKPVTDNHPEELVTPSNAKQYIVGLVGDAITQDGDFMKAELTITDADAIAKVEAGKVELSNGYLSDMEFVKGVTEDGKEYDAIQRNIRGNHVAIVEKGRCGESCRLSDEKPTEEKPMPKLTLDSVDYEASEQVVQAVAKLQADAAKDADSLKALNDELKSIKDDSVSKADYDALQAKLDDAASKVPNAEMLDALVAKRTETVAVAAKVIDGYKWEGKDCAAIKREVVAAARPNLSLDSKSDDYINALFDMVADDVASGKSTTLDAALSDAEKSDKEEMEDEEDPVEAKRKEMADAARNAWKKETK